MVHADVDVAGARQTPDGERQDLQLRLGRRQVGLPDAPLRLEQRGEVGVAVERNAVWIERDDLVERGVEAIQRLVRQAVDQIKADRAKAAGARFFDHAARLGLALHAMHRLLDRLVEVLDADRKAVEAQVGEECHAPGLGAARIHLDRDLGFRLAFELRVEQAHQRGHLLAREERRRAAAPVQLADPALGSSRRPQ